MGSTRLAAVWMRSRAQLRRRRRSWLVLAVLVGIASGFVMATAAGARRTSSSYERLLSATKPFDIIWACSFDDESANCPGQLQAAYDRPEVAEHATVYGTVLPLTTTDGRPLSPGDDACYSGPGEVRVIGSTDASFLRDINPLHIIEGRTATRANEVLLSAATARRLHLGVGDHVRYQAVSCDGTVATKKVPTDLVVVGIQVAPMEIQPEKGATFSQSITITPELTDVLLKAHVIGPVGAVTLRPGTDAAKYISDIEKTGLGVTVNQRTLTAQVESSLRPDALGLVILGVLGGIAAILILAQALSRQVWSDATDVETLRAVGFTHRNLVASGAVQGALTGLVGALIGVAIAIAASPFIPIGRARNIDFASGPRADFTVFALGTLATIVVVTALVALTSWRVSRWDDASLRRGGRVFALGPNASPAMSYGLRMALDRGEGIRTVPVRSGLAGITIGLTAVVATVTFAASLNHLLATPRLFGVTWDAVYELPQGAPPDVVAQNIEKARHISGIQRIGVGTFNTDEAVFEGVDTTGFVAFEPGARSVSPAVARGRLPRTGEEIIVTNNLLDRLHKRVGDTVVLHGLALSGNNEDETVPTQATMRIVGTGVIPTGVTGLDAAIALTSDGAHTLFPDFPPNALYLTFAPGADRAAATRQIEGLGLHTAVPQSLAEPTDLAGLDVDNASLIPRWLGVLMALLASAVLAHVIAISVLTRRHEMATLRTIGFTRRQVHATLAWSATTLVVISAAIGSVFGVVAGRAIWSVYAGRIDVVNEPVTPWLAVALVAIAALVFANLVALVVSREANRHSPAEVLRTE